MVNESIEHIVDIFWTEFKNFQTDRFPFDVLANSLLKMLWQATLMFGMRSNDVKMIKDGKRSNLSGGSLEKQAILYISANLEEARICSEHKCSNDFGKKIRSKLPIYCQIDFVNSSHNFCCFADLILN